MPEVGRLPGTGTSDEDDRLVPSRREHVVVSGLGCRVDVRRHVFRFATLEEGGHFFRVDGERRHRVDHQEGVVARVRVYEVRGVPLSQDVEDAAFV